MMMMLMIMNSWMFGIVVGNLRVSHDERRFVGYHDSIVRHHRWYSVHHRHRAWYESHIGVPILNVGSMPVPFLVLQWIS